jgi:diphosphate--fructose-6-phosphate 1-phosphotransferase
MHACSVLELFYPEVYNNLCCCSTGFRAVHIVISSGPAPGGHNVICGLFHYLQRLNPRNQLFGFIDGVDGILKSKFITITPELCASFLNQGGFHMIGSGRGKIDSEKQKKTALSVCQAMRLNGLVVVGGDDSNTNAAVLAEYFLAKQCPIRVCGVPKTIDGDLRNDHVEVRYDSKVLNKYIFFWFCSYCSYFSVSDSIPQPKFTPKQ